METNKKLLDYPFDLYQRTRDIREIVECIATEQGKAKLRILDVGGFRLDAEDRNDLLLREFLPQHEIISLDLMASDIPGYVQGDGTCLPFKDNSFDIVVTSDVFEHVPPHLREAFVDNLVRVATSFVILGAPFFSEKNALAEQILLEYVFKVLHAEQEQLKEHIDNGLPDEQALISLLETHGLSYTRLSSGNLENWVMMMMVKHYLMTIPDSQHVHTLVDRFYNMSNYGSDHRGEGYRKIFVVAKDPSLKETLQQITARFATLAQTDQAGSSFPADSDLGRFRLLLDLEELRTRRLFAEKDLLIRTQAAQLEALNGLRSTRLCRFIRGSGKLFFKSLARVTRLSVLKTRLVCDVVSGKRKHPLLSLSDGLYRRWLQKQTPDATGLSRLREEAAAFSYRPLISIVMPIYNTAKQWLDEAFVSILDQVYDNWELCVVNDGSGVSHVKETLLGMQKQDVRVRVFHFHRNRGIAAATNRALAMAKGEFVAFMDSDDRLHPLALWEMVKLLNLHPEADMIYSDEDKLSVTGMLRKPVFKPDWSAELFLSFNYINHLTMCRRALVERVGGFNKTYDWSQDYDLYLRITELTDKIFHIPKVLYHWRAIPGSSAARVDFRTEALEKSRQLLTDTLVRRGIPGTVVNGLRPGTFKIIK